VTEVSRNGELAKRNYYFTNFAPVKNCLFHLPKTTVSVRTGDRQLIVKNDGKVPAVGVNVSRPGHGDTFFSDENYFWLNPGESKTLAVNTTEGVVAQGWNV
jgi:beta-mannosidase